MYWIWVIWLLDKLSCLKFTKPSSPLIEDIFIWVKLTLSILSFQSILSNVFDCIILQFYFINSSVISFELVSYFSSNVNLSLGQWLSHYKWGSIFANFKITLCSSSKGLNNTLIYLRLSLVSCKIFKLSYELRELWLISRCSNFKALIPANVVILLWLASNFFKFFKFYNSTRLDSWLYEITKTYKLMKEEIKGNALIFKFERLANWSTEGSSIFNFLMSNYSVPSNNKFSLSS